MIARYIIQLLKSQDAVALTHFGTFVKERIPARIEEGRILPPHFVVTFHSEETSNPLDFLSEIAKREKISLMEADAKVTAWTENVLGTLDNEHQLHIENFGTFSGNASWFSFVCDELPELNDDFEGMPSIELPHPPSAPSGDVASRVSLSDDTPSAPCTDAACHVSPSDDTPSAPSGDVASRVSPADGAPSADQPEIAESESKKKSYKWISILCFILVILASIAFLLYIFREPVQLKINELKERYFLKEVVAADTLAAPQQEPAVEEEDTTLFFSDTLAADSLANDLYPTADEQPEQVEVKTPVAVVQQKSTQSFPRIDFEPGRFYVIAGSFSSFEKATQHAQLKASQGFTPSLLYQTGTRKIRICVAVFNSESEANAYLSNHTGFWILQ